MKIKKSFKKPVFKISLDQYQEWIDTQVHAYIKNNTRMTETDYSVSVCNDLLCSQEYSIRFKNIKFMDDLNKLAKTYTLTKEEDSYNAQIEPAIDFVNYQLKHQINEVKIFMVDMKNKNVLSQHVDFKLPENMELLAVFTERKTMNEFFKTDKGHFSGMVVKVGLSVFVFTHISHRNNMFKLHDIINFKDEESLYKNYYRKVYFNFYINNFGDDISYKFQESLEYLKTSLNQQAMNPYSFISLCDKEVFRMSNTIISIDNKNYIFSNFLDDTPDLQGVITEDNFTIENVNESLLSLISMTVY